MSEETPVCECIDLVNKALGERHPGAALDVPFRIDLRSGKELPPLTTVPVWWANPKLKKRGQKVPLLFARFCPFCGKEGDPK